MEFKNNEHRPFCSERCKLLDLGAWADEKYSIPADVSELTVEEIESIVNSAEDSTN